MYNNGIRENMRRQFSEAVFDDNAVFLHFQFKNHYTEKPARADDLSDGSIK